MTDMSASEDEYRQLGLWNGMRLGDLLRTRAAAHPDRELFTFRGTRTTYGEMDRWVTAVSARLVEAGVQRGDSVLVQLPNCLEALVMQMSAFRIGALATPVMPIYREHEVRQILGDARPTAIAVASALGDRRPTEEIDRLLAEIGLAPVVKFAVGDPVPGWESVPAASASIDATLLPEPAEPHEPALLLFTSGTTAAPKGALLSSRALVAHLVNQQRLVGMDENTVLCAGTPLSHLGGFVAGVILPAFLGARSAILPAWQADDAVRVIEEEGVTVMMGATLFIREIVDRYAAGGGQGHRLKNYLCAGATIPPQLVLDAEAQGVRMVRTYGMTETAGICSAVSLDDGLERRAYWDGRAVPGMEIQVVDEDRRPVPSGEVGELRCRGAQLLLRYTDPVVTAAQFDAEGWFYPGDVGVMDDEGWLRMTGRSKDIVNRGGEKFSTMDIEMAIRGYEGIKDVAVTAVPDERFGEAVGAWVVMAEGTPWPGAESVVAYLKDQKLTLAKIPVDWHVVDAIPASATGKIQKHRLVEVPDLDVALGVRA